MFCTKKNEFRRLAHARMSHTSRWAASFDSSRVFRNKEKEMVRETIVSVLIGSKDPSKMFLFFY